MKIGSTIKILRIQKKISQRTLAARVDISQSMLSLLENDNADPSFKTLLKIAKQLEVKLSYLILKSEDGFV